MAENCKNCNDLITNNFCPNCGQKKYKRIDKKFIADEIQYTFLHMNKGFWYSVKSIIKNSGKTAREFIDGNRINHYKPILLTFVLSGIATFLTYKVLGLREIMSAYYENNHMSSKFTNDLLSFLSTYTSILMLALVPFFALATKIAFKKYGHNYFEHIVINSYFLSFYTIFSIIFIYPILFIFRNNSPQTSLIITQLSMLVVPILLVWFFKEFYPEKKLKNIIINVLISFGLVILGYLLLLLIAILIGVAIAMIMGPETLKYMTK